jgi:hypothetical protein
MQPGAQLAVGIAGGIAIIAVGAVFAGRAAGAIYAVAALGLAALGLMLLADLLIGVGLTLSPQPGNSLSGVSLLIAGLQVGAIALALLALILMLMGACTGIAWSVRQRRFGDLPVLGGALVAQLAGAAVTSATIFGWLLPVPLLGMQRLVVSLAGFGLGTLAAALIAFWALPVVRRGARARRASASGPAV